MNCKLCIAELRGSAGGGRAAGLTAADAPGPQPSRAAPQYDSSTKWGRQVWTHRRLGCAYWIPLQSSFDHPVLSCHLFCSAARFRQRLYEAACDVDTLEEVLHSPLPNRQLPERMLLVAHRQFGSELQSVSSGYHSGMERGNT